MYKGWVPACLVCTYVDTVSVVRKKRIKSPSFMWSHTWPCGIAQPWLPAIGNLLNEPVNEHENSNYHL